jgi:NAD(P)-dependent dehydrogenase (short-subunit alcohol dehydrogenase family)
MTREIRPGATMDPKGKVALLTGGARIGQAVALALAVRGCSLALTYLRSREVAESTAAAARAAGVTAIALRADVTDEEQVRAAVNETAASLGRLDILINMASVYEKALNPGAAEWSRGLDTNARSAFLFAIHAAPLMKAAGSGRIINISDWLALSSRPRYKGYTPYYTAKAAVAALTESLALELAPQILVNAIAPGPIVAPAHLTPKERTCVTAATPLGRWGGAEEIAKAVLFLIETEFVTGECIRVDGGRHLH